MDITVKNLPLDRVYKFDDNKYIVTHRVFYKNASSYMMNTPTEYTYVYEFENDRVSNCIYGRIVDKQEPYDINKEFRLITHDTEEVVEYDINIPLHEITGEEKSIICSEMLIYNVNPEKYMNSKRK